MGSIQGAAIRFLLRRSNVWNKPLTQIRKSMEDMKANGIPEGISATSEEVNGVACEVFRCNDKKQGKVLLYFHGGGYCLGIYPSNREFVARIAAKAEVDVYMPDYRLAPEHPFPAALEDAVAIYKGMLKKGYKEKDVIIMGDSSGSALAVSALLVLKQNGEKMPKALAFITPVFDLVGQGETFITKAGKDPFKLKDPLGIVNIYTGVNNPSSSMLSPLFGDLKGLPPTLIHAADYDVFLSDSLRFGEMMKTSGGEIEIKVWRKMWHIFHMQDSIVPEARKALDELCSFIKDKG